MVKNCCLLPVLGTFGFFSNPLLCPAEIKKLADLTGISSNFSHLEVYGNGDKSACNFTDLILHIQPNVTNVTIGWELPPLSQNDLYIGFTVYYIEHDRGNISTFESQNVCDGRGWNSQFTSNNSIMLLNLRPFKRYAFYIKLYQSSMLGAQTPVNYFKTLPREPKAPLMVRITATGPDSILLTWQPPIRINGILSYYRLYVVMERDYNVQQARDYCLHEMS